MNYTSNTRTNYFRVIPEKEQEFLAFMKTLRGEDHVSLFDIKNKEGEQFYGFGLYGCLGGAADPALEDDSDEMWDELQEKGWKRMEDKLQEFLLPGDAVIIEHAGNEGLRYVSANYTIITKDKVLFKDMTASAIDDAAQMLGDPDFQTRCEY